MFTQEVQWMVTHVNGKNAHAKLFRTTAAAVYNIWQERNNRIFQSKKRNDVGLSRLIIQMVVKKGSLKAKLESRIAELNFYP